MKKIIYFGLAIIGLVAFFCGGSGFAALAITPALTNDDIVKIFEGEARKRLGFEGGGFMENYDGRGDIMLDFDGPVGASSFRSVVETPRIFTITVATSNVANSTFYLTPGPLWNAGGLITGADYKAGTPPTVDLTYTDGQVRDGAFNDSAGNGYLTGTGNPKSIDEFLTFIYNNPTSCLGIKVSANDNANQMNKTFTNRPYSPFRDLETKLYMPTSFQNQDTYRDKICLFATPGLILCRDARLEYSIMGKSGGTSVDITFFCGAVQNSSKTMETKTKLAIANVGRPAVK